MPLKPLILFLLLGCNNIKQEKEKLPSLPDSVSYTCLHCQKEHYLYIYWSLDTNTLRSQNIKKLKHDKRTNYQY